MAWIRIIDRASMIAMVVAIVLMLQPWWSGGFQFGFWFLLVTTLIQIVFSHVPLREPVRDDQGPA